MSVEIRIPTVNGIKLLTKGKYVEDDISITFDPSLLTQDFTIEDALVTRAITSYSNYRITSLGNFAFRDCRSLKKLIVPNVVTLNPYSMSGCTGLQEVDFSSVKTFGQNSFQNSKITTLVLPSITEIASSAFLSATITNLVITQSDSVAVLHSTNAFSSSSIASGTGFIYVPDSLVEQYKVATNWSTYASQIKPLSELEG